MEDRLSSIIEFQLLAELKHVIRASKGVLEPLSRESEELYARYYASTDENRYYNYNIQNVPIEFTSDHPERYIPTFIEYVVKLLTEHGYNNDRYSQLTLNDMNRFEWEDQFDYRLEKYYDDLKSICSQAKKIANYLSEGSVLDASQELKVLKYRFEPLIKLIDYCPVKLSPEQLHVKVIAMINHVKSIIEYNGIWKSVTDEKSVQRLIYASVSALCKMDNIDLSPEVDSGNGPVDIKFSQGSDCKVVVEVKLSTNPKVVHGYEKQLEIYKQSDNTDRGIFVLIDLGSMGKKLEKINKIRKQFIEEKGVASEIVVIDAAFKKSASKRN